RLGLERRPGHGGAGGVEREERSGDRKQQGHASVLPRRNLRCAARWARLSRDGGSATKGEEPARELLQHAPPAPFFAAIVHETKDRCVLLRWSPDQAPVLDRSRELGARQLGADIRERPVIEPEVEAQLFQVLGPLGDADEEVTSMSP